MSAPRESGKIIGAIGPTSREAAIAAGPNEHGQVAVGEVNSGRYFALVPKDDDMDNVIKRAADIIRRCRKRNVAS